MRKNFSSNISDGKSKFLSKTGFISLTIIGIIAFSIRLYYFQWDLPISLDAISHFMYAGDIVTLGHLPDWILANNGWPAFLSLIFSLVDSNNPFYYMQIQKLTTVFLSTVTIIPLYFISKRFFEPRFCLIAISLFAFQPLLIQSSLLGGTDHLYVLLGTIAICLFLHQNKKIMYSSFAVLSLMTMVRSEGLFLFVALSIIYFIRYRKVRFFIPKYIPVLLIFVLILLPVMNQRIEVSGTDNIFIKTSTTFSYHTKSPEETGGESGLPFVINGMKNFPIYVGWSLVPILICFVPIGFILMFRSLDYKKLTIIFSLILLSLPLFYIYAIDIQDTRYVFMLFPLFSLVSIYFIEKIDNKINKKNIFVLIFIAGILVTSFVFLEYKKVDVTHEKESQMIALYVLENLGGFNDYYPETQYIPASNIIRHDDFPTLSDNYKHNMPKFIVFDESSTIEEYIQVHKKEGLSHLVLDDGDNRKEFFNQVFNNESDYPYLEKVFDSNEKEFEYHVKIFKIDYKKFENEYG